VAGGTITLGPWINSLQTTSTSILQTLNGANLTITPQNNASASWTNNSSNVTIGSGSTLTITASTWSNAGTITLNGATANFGGTFTQANVGSLVRAGVTTVNLVGNLTGGLSLDSTTAL